MLKKFTNWRMRKEIRALKADVAKGDLSSMVALGWLYYRGLAEGNKEMAYQLWRQVTAHEQNKKNKSAINSANKALKKAKQI